MKVIASPELKAITRERVKDLTMCGAFVGNP